MWSWPCSSVTSPCRISPLVRRIDVRSHHTKAHVHLFRCGRDGARRRRHRRLTWRRLPPSQRAMSCVLFPPRASGLPHGADAGCVLTSCPMKVVHGRVEHGHVVVDEPLPEGTEVTVVVAAAGDEAFDLDEEQIAALRESIEQADRGELVPLDEVLRGQ